MSSFWPAISRVVREKTLHPFETAAKESNHRISAQVRERIMNENIDRAGDDVVSGRAKLAFFANNLTITIAVKDCRALGPVFQLGARNFF